MAWTGTIRVYAADGKSEPVVLHGHKERSTASRSAPTAGASSARARTVPCASGRQTAPEPRCCCPRTGSRRPTRGSTTAGSGLSPSRKTGERFSRTQTGAASPWSGVRPGPRIRGVQSRQHARGDPCRQPARRLPVDGGWRGERKGRVQTLRGHTSFVNTARFSADGKHRRTGSRGRHGAGVAHRWHRRAARAAYGRQRRRLLGRVQPRSDARADGQFLGAGDRHAGRPGVWTVGWEGADCAPARAHSRMPDGRAAAEVPGEAPTRRDRARRVVRGQLREIGNREVTRTSPPRSEGAGIASAMGCAMTRSPARTPRTICVAAEEEHGRQKSQWSAILTGSCAKTVRRRAM